MILTLEKFVPSEGGINFHMDIYVGSDVSDKQIARLQKELTEVDFGTDQIQVLRTTDPPEDKTKVKSAGQCYVVKYEQELSVYSC